MIHNVCTCLIRVVLVAVMPLLLMLLNRNLLSSATTVLMLAVVVGRRLQVLFLVLVSVVTWPLHDARVRYRHLRVGEVSCILEHRHRVATVRLHTCRCRRSRRHRGRRA